MHFMYFVYALFTQPAWLSCLLFDSTKINVQWDLWQNESAAEQYAKALKWIKK